MEQIPAPERDGRAQRRQQRNEAISRTHKAKGSQPSRSRHVIYLNVETFTALVEDIGGLYTYADIADHFKLGVGTVYSAHQGRRVTDVFVSAVMKEVRGLSSYQYENLFIEADVEPVAA